MTFVIFLPLFISQVSQWVDGRGKCPYSPEANSSAYMNSQGDFYIASSTDFSANDHAIYKMSGWPDLNQGLLRSVQYNSMWLSQTNFVLTFETETFVYFVFRENAVEYSNCGQTIYSRFVLFFIFDRELCSKVLKEALLLLLFLLGSNHE